MSHFECFPACDDVRYSVSLDYCKESSYVIYHMTIVDLGLGLNHKVQCRFSEIRKLHEKLVKELKENKTRMPEFPQRNSFAFWNRTNDNPRKIEERR